MKSPLPESQQTPEYKEAYAQAMTDSVVLSLLERFEAIRALHPKIEHPTYGCCAAPAVCGNYHEGVRFPHTVPMIHPDVCGAREHGLNRPNWPCPTMQIVGEV